MRKKKKIRQFYMPVEKRYRQEKNMIAIAGVAEHLILTIGMYNKSLVYGITSLRLLIPIFLPYMIMAFCVNFLVFPPRED